MFGDPAVWSSLKNTLIFTAMSTPPLVIIALVMALLANRRPARAWLLRLSYFAPFVLPVDRRDADLGVDLPAAASAW